MVPHCFRKNGLSRWWLSDESAHGSTERSDHPLSQGGDPSRRRKRKSCICNPLESKDLSDALSHGMVAALLVKDQALDGALAPAPGPFPASGRPPQPQLGTRNSQASCPLIPQPCTDRLGSTLGNTKLAFTILR